MSFARPLYRFGFFILISTSLNVGVATSHAQVKATLDIDVGKPTATIPPTFFGLMTEEINHSYDGGLYAELIQNRTFQDPQPQGRGRDLPAHWSVVGSGKATVEDVDPVNAALPRSLQLELDGKEAGIANDGYWGIPVRPNTTYTATFYAKGGGGFAGPITASLRTDKGDAVVARAETKPITEGWQKYTVNLKTDGNAPTTADARFVLSAVGQGNVTFSYVSLFPPTYKDVANGLRPDLMKLLAGLQPKFIRLPGGNYLEGGRFADRFNWKQMIGPPDQRPGHMGCWSYRSSDGLGLPEFMLWCQQLGAEPVLGLFAGYVLNGDHFNAGSPEMALYTQEALEEIEYFIGSADTKWGKQRAEDGFPEPFSLKYVEIGNEDWFDRSGSYDGRFTQMAKAIRERYPQLKIIASAPVKSFKPDLYDDHFYRSPKQLRGMFSLYDKPTGTPKPLRFEGGGWDGRFTDGTQTFVGEWATHDGRPITNLNAALSDAAFTMGMERNADAVVMQCYAPLLANVNHEDREKGYPRGWQWEYNLIGYDALQSYGSPSYYAQMMLAQNRGDVALTTNLDVSQVEPPRQEVPHGRIGLGSWETDVEYTGLSVTTPDGKKLFEPDLKKQIEGMDTPEGDWQVRDNSIRPVRRNASTWAFMGDPQWTDYTVNVRARKRGGREGFIILWHATDKNNYHWWNIGGWGNTATQAEAVVEGGKSQYGASTDFTVEANRWYDLRLEVTGNRIRGYVDGELVTDTSYESTEPASPPVYASATYDKASQTALVRVVNAGTNPVDMAINVQGVSRVEPKATAIVLQGEPGDVNSLDEPEKVKPQQEAVDSVSTSFQRTFPAHSFTILQVKTTR
jgi:alpha-L-arabinofuranosidase